MRFGENDTYRRLLLSVDALNTIHGGVSDPQFSMEKNETEYEIRVRIPGVEAELIHVEIHNNELTIYYLHQFEHTGDLEDTQLPHIVKKMQVPFDVNIKQIKARYEANCLYVSLPLNDLASGYHRDIDIDK